MAECQATYHYNTSNILALKANLSQPRFKTFRSFATDDTEAFAYYLYNARLSKSFLFPLHVIEVTVRNAVDHILCKDFSTNWPSNPTFHGVLTKESSEALNTAIQRAHQVNKPSRDDIIATLNFDFWSNLFRQEYDRPLWQTRMALLTPNDKTITRASFKKEISSINHFRNRIAHHEPILGLDVSKMHSSIIAMVASISKETSSWLKSHSTVMKMMRTSPDKRSAHVAGNICDKNYIVIDGAKSLDEVIVRKEAFVIVYDDNTGLHHILDKHSIGEFISKNLVGGDMIDLKEHSAIELVKALPETQAIAVRSDTTVLELAEKFKKDPSRFAAIFHDGALMGIVARAHRRY